MKNKIVLSLIGVYQKYISPYKGFSCAFRVKTQECSCSAYGKKVFAKYNFLTAFKLLRRRFVDCSWAAQSYTQKSTSLQDEGAYLGQTLNIDKNKRLYQKYQRGDIAIDCIPGPDCGDIDCGDSKSGKTCNLLSDILSCSGCDLGTGSDKKNEFKEKRFAKNEKKYKQSKEKQDWQE